MEVSYGSKWGDFNQQASSTDPSIFLITYPVSVHGAEACLNTHTG